MVRFRYQQVDSTESPQVGPSMNTGAVVLGLYNGALAVLLRLYIYLGVFGN